MKELKLEANVDNLDRVIEFVDAELEKMDCGMKVQMQIDIAMEEIFVNIAHYAYAPSVGDAVIQIQKDDLSNVRITFIDSGIPYNPLEKPDPDVTLSAEEREIGGLGIYMVKKSMDRVSYEYKDGKNIFTMEKAF